MTIWNRLSCTYERIRCRGLIFMGDVQNASNLKHYRGEKVTKLFSNIRSTTKHDSFLGHVFSDHAPLLFHDIRPSLSRSHSHAWEHVISTFPRLVSYDCSNVGHDAKYFNAFNLGCSIFHTLFYAIPKADAAKNLEQVDHGNLTIVTP